jgi:hypothetical protein
MNGAMVLSKIFSPTLFNTVQIGVNRISTHSHTDSHFYDVTGIFNSVQIPGFDTLNQEADSVKAPTTYSIKDDVTGSAAPIPSRQASKSSASFTTTARRRRTR